MGVVEGKIIKRRHLGWGMFWLNWPNRIQAEGRSRRSNITQRVGDEDHGQISGVIRCQGWGIWLNWLSRVLAKTRHMNTPESNPVGRGFRVWSRWRTCHTAGCQVRECHMVGCHVREESMNGWLGDLMEDPFPGRGGAGWHGESEADNKRILSTSCQAHVAQHFLMSNSATWWA